MPRQPDNLAQLGTERFDATCLVCGRRWSVVGTLPARRARAHAQDHATRHGHVIDAHHTNRR